MLTKKEATKPSNLLNPCIKGAHANLAYEYGRKVANEQA
jgi:hypothetical protein